MAENLNGVVINEILYDPTIGGGNTGRGFDTNQDGVVGQSDDEFVELFNTSDSAVDISGWTLGDNDAETDIVFPQGTVIAPQEHLLGVVFWNSDSIPDYAFSGMGTLGDGGDVVILSDDEGNSIAATYGNDSETPEDIPLEDLGDFSNNTDGQSIQRDPDGSDNVELADPTPECFLPGTQILTEDGYKNVEELKIGDRLQTADGKIEPIKWIGYQTVNPAKIANPLRGFPVEIKAGALGENLPTRNLYVSPDHALLVDGLLINAGALVNGVSIVKTEPTETFVYHHIELENHALLIAEGTLAETYLPQKEDRLIYDNGAEYEELYPHGSNLMLWPMDYPRVSSTNKVPRYIKQRLDRIASNIEDIQLQSA